MAGLVQACPGHPPLRPPGGKTWMRRTSPRMRGTFESRRAALRRPWALERREADQVALQEVAAPVGEQLGRRLVLHPFGDGREAEALGELDQGAHEGAVVLRAGEVLHEGAVDLDQVDPQLAQVAE